MAKGMYHYLREAWKKTDEKLIRDKMLKWRRSEAVVKIDKPTRLDRARSLGYKAKKGFIVVRVRIKRGGRKRPTRSKGRRSKRQTIRKVVKMNYRWIAEARVARKFPNMEVLNSYQIGKDGVHYFFEVILVDKNRPEIKNDKTINWICRPSNKNRVFRGLTGAGKKSRGLKKKSPQNKNRPSVNSGSHRGK